MYRLRGCSTSLPEGLTHLRLVEIVGVDLNACGGTHVRCLGELQMVKFTGAQRVSDGVTRVDFKAGGRVLAALAAQLAVNAGLNRALSCGPEDYVRKVSSLQVQAKAADKAHKQISKELADQVARGLRAAAGAAGGGQGVAHYHQAEGGGVKFFQAVARACADQHAAAGADAGAAPLLLLTGGAADGAGQFVVALAAPAEAVSKADGAFVSALGKEVAALLDGRGGGGKGKYQGKAKQLGQTGAALAAMRAAYAKHLAGGGGE